jgi:hypothetical protein
MPEYRRPSRVSSTRNHTQKAKYSVLTTHVGTQPKLLQTLCKLRYSGQIPQ